MVQKNFDKTALSINKELESEELELKALDYVAVPEVINVKAVELSRQRDKLLNSIGQLIEPGRAAAEDGLTEQHLGRYFNSFVQLVQRNPSYTRYILPARSQDSKLLKILKQRKDISRDRDFLEFASYLQPEIEKTTNLPVEILGFDSG